MRDLRYKIDPATFESGEEGYAVSLGLYKGGKFLCDERRTVTREQLLQLREAIDEAGAHFTVEGRPQPCKRYLMGQRVIVNGSEIGVVVAARQDQSHIGFDIWVHLSGSDYTTGYHYADVMPLPGGQL